MIKRVVISALLGLLTVVPLRPARAAEVIEADVCIYGGTAGGVVAAVQAARMGPPTSGTRR